MEFIETKIFTKQITELLSDDEYRILQNQLIGNPEIGNIIKGSGGIRKVRHAIQGVGKSSGIRVIYYWICSHDKIHMLLSYPKSKKDNLSPKEISILKSIVDEILKSLQLENHNG
jgi:mRNA-degrading endonuclease RelE of RelBE toxin-antitoxin system